MAALTVRVSRARHLRRGKAERGHRRGRLRRLNRWLDARADTTVNNGIGDTGAAPVAVTADNTTELIAEAAHGFSDGAGPMLIAAGTLPTGLSAERPYFLNSNTAGDYFLVRDRADALKQISPEPFSTNGATVTREPGASAWSFYSMLRAGIHPSVIQASTDVDTLIYS